MAIKPADGHIEWITDDDSDKYIAPSAAKRLQGWVQQEKPPFQYFNWFWRLVDRWLKWAETQSDENVAAIAANALDISAAQAAISAEATARSDADTTLENSIDAEALARANADTQHAQLTDPHNATSAAVADRLILRDNNGRAKVAAPSEADDIARKDTINNAIAPSYMVDQNAGAVTLTTSGVQIATLDLGTVSAGDVLFVEAKLAAAKLGTAGRNNYYINQQSGTATIAFPKTAISRTSYLEASTSFNEDLGGMCFITGAGTLTLQIVGYSYGSNSTISTGQCDLAATFIKKQ